MKKRWRRPKVKPGVLMAYYGKDDDGEGPDVVFAWGEGLGKREGAFLHCMFGAKRYALQDVEPSFIDQLKARGYDISTLKFSIEKLPASPPCPSP